MRGSEQRLAALVVALAACAPATGRAATAPAVAVSAAGAVAVAWAGRAYVARPPGYELTPLSGPAAAADVAWRDGDPWLALPAAGLVVRASGVPQTLSFPGRPARLSGSRIFLEDGSVYGYDGAAAGRLPGLPDAVLERGDRSWALVGGVVYELATAPRALERAPAGATALRFVGGRAQAVPGPEVEADGTTVLVAEGRLEARGVAGALRGSADAPTGPWALAAGPGTLAVAAPGRLRVHRLPDLALLADRELPSAGTRP